MKYVFAAVAAVLILSSLLLHASFPDVRSDVPVIYWVTDNNPARQQQVALFHQWLIRNDHAEAVTVSTPEDLRKLQSRHFTPAVIEAMRAVDEDAKKVWGPDGAPLEVAEADLPLRVRIPIAELRTDNANRDITKQVIQGVSGVGGDIVDTTGLNLPYMHALGIATNVTQWGQELGFDPSQTFPAIVPDITIEDYAEGGPAQQYAFPCNVWVSMYWVNKDTFEKLGVPVPPRRWTIEEFESLGKQFVAAANPPGQRQTVFFSMSVDKEELQRSMGLSLFNETLTRPQADDPRFARSLALIYKWTYEDHLLPSAAERASFDTQSGYGGPVLQLFNQGKLGMFRMGRYALIQLRRFGNLNLTAVEPPHGGFPTTMTGTRCAMVYVGGEPELAKYFLSYLASESYNMQIVRDADALPPNPKYTLVEEFTRPPDYPNEWGVHELFSNAAQDIAIGSVQSPFVLASQVSRFTTDAEQAVMAGRLTPEAAAEEAQQSILREIERTLAEEPGLRPMYDRLVTQQQEIDRLRAEGKKVPVRLIANPFYRRYYAAQGWLEEAASQTDAATTPEVEAPAVPAS